MSAPAVIPPDLARRLDRASRRAHRFHRFAHHPLCDEYAPETFRVAGLVFCRGCVLGGLGIATGLAAGFFAAPSPAAAAGVAGLGALSLVLGRGKVARRLLPAVGLDTALGAAFATPSLPHIALALLALGFAAGAWRAWRRRGPNRAPCTTCAERTLPVCRGFAEIVRAEQEFRARAGEAVRRLGEVPSPAGRAASI